MKTPDDRAGATWLRYTHLGLQYCLILLLFVFGGQWLDGRMGTEPWLMLTGALLGFGASTWLIVSQMARIGR